MNFCYNSIQLINTCFYHNEVPCAPHHHTTKLRDYWLPTIWLYNGEAFNTLWGLFRYDIITYGGYKPKDGYDDKGVVEWDGNEGKRSKECPIQCKQCCNVLTYFNHIFLNNRNSKDIWMSIWALALYLVRIFSHLISNQAVFSNTHCIFQVTVYLLAWNFCLVHFLKFLP